MKQKGPVHIGSPTQPDTPPELPRHREERCGGILTAGLRSRQTAAIVDCYTVEPSGLGVPPYLSTYARAAFAALKRALPDADVRYLTIDDVRWCVNGGRAFTEPPLSDQLTYSATINRSEAPQILADAAVLVVIAGYLRGPADWQLCCGCL